MGVIGQSCLDTAATDIHGITIYIASIKTAGGTQGNYIHYYQLWVMFSYTKRLLNSHIIMSFKANHVGITINQ